MFAKPIAILLLLAAPALAAAQMNTLPSQPHLLVKGQGERTVVPDRFTVTLALQSTDLDTDAARRKVEANAAEVIAALKRNHVVEGSLYASSLSITPSYEYRDNQQVFKGNRVARQIRGTFARREDTQAFLAAVAASAEMQIADLAAGYGGEAVLRGQLKREAVEQTRDTAAQLAQAYGTRITGLYSISDVAPDFAYGVQAGTWPSGPIAFAEARPTDGYSHAGGGAPAPVADVGARVGTTESLESGTLTFTENVYAIFLIRP